MSRTKHQRGTPKHRQDRLRKNKEWGQDSSWKPKERPKINEKDRRSPRTRLK